MRKFVALFLFAILTISVLMFGGCDEKPVEYDITGDYQPSTYENVMKIIEGKNTDWSTGNYKIYQDMTNQTMINGEYLKTNLTLTGLVDVSNVEFVGHLDKDYTASGFNIQQIMQQDPTALMDTEFILKDNKTYMTYKGLKVYTDLEDLAGISFTELIKFLEEISDKTEINQSMQDMVFAVCEEENLLKISIKSTESQSSVESVENTNLQIYLIFDGDNFVSYLFNLKTELRNKDGDVKNSTVIRVTVSDEQLSFPDLTQYEKYKGNDLR